MRPSAAVCRLGHGESTGSLENVWRAVDALVDRNPDLDRLAAHRIELVAAARRRALGLAVPRELIDRMRISAATSLGTIALLERVRPACEGPILVFKGPEVAARYRDPALRPYRDLDLLVADADAAQAQLLAAGFRGVGDPSLYRGIHHLRPLALGTSPLAVELHSRPKWIEGASPPPTEGLLAAGIPSVTGVEGILAPPPAQHALLLAGHSWAHEPLRRLGDLIDVAAVAAEADPAEIGSLACAWGIERLWRSTSRAIEAVLFGGPQPWPLRTWARDLEDARHRTVLESHLERWLAPFASLPPHRAVMRLPSTFVAELLPAQGEGWRSKVARTRLALRDAFLARAEHDRKLE